MTDMNATCPFYRGEKVNTVYCEAENKKFCDRKEKSTHKAKYCCDMEGMKNCPQYISQMEKYKKEEKNEDTMEPCYFKSKNSCSVTTRKSCLGCSFRKTEEQVMQGRRNATARIESLPEQRRNDIKARYYEGNNEI